MGKHNKDKQLFFNKKRIEPKENKNSSRRKKASVTIGTYSRFLSEEELVNNILKDEMRRLNFKPVVEVDPSTIKVDKTKMTEAEKCFMLARKYRFDDPTYALKNIWQANKFRAMSDRDIKTVKKIVAEIKATKTRPD